MSKKYIPEGSWLACNKGSCPSSFRVSHNNNTLIYGSKLASEADLMPFFNIKPMGFCSVTKKMCIPAVSKWDDPQEGVFVNNHRLLKEDSTCKCVVGGKIKLYFDRAAAATDCVGGAIKMPSEYIKEGFDQMAEQQAKSKETMDAMLPEWMKSVTHAAYWFNNFKMGMVEGAVNGIVGTGEAIYQIVQDPVGTAEAIGGMAKKGYDAAREGLTNAWEFGANGDNWSSAYNSTKAWVSDSKNLKEAANVAWESTKAAGEWVSKNPRQIGTSIGEFAPDIAAAIYTAGGSTAATAARAAVKETAGLARGAVTKAKQLAPVEAARLAEKAEDLLGDVVVKTEEKLAAEKTAKNLKDAKNKFDADKATNKQKGNFGEMASADNMLNNPELKKKGYNLKRIGDDAPGGLDDKLEKGIDGIYENQTPPPKYVIDETKFGKSELSQTPKDGPQGSDAWIKGSERLERQVGFKEAEDIRDAMQNGEVEKVLSKVDSSGKVTTYKINPDGSVGKPWP